MTVRRKFTNQNVFPLVNCIGDHPVYSENDGIKSKDAYFKSLPFRTYVIIYF